jgi:hypothetical protein
LIKTSSGPQRPAAAKVDVERPPEDDHCDVEVFDSITSKVTTYKNGYLILIVVEAQRPEVTKISKKIESNFGYAYLGRE